jgi:tRNA(adenine34) deaminase
LVASGFNQPIALHDPSAHAEMLALRAAGLALQNYRLPGLELFVTLEPCAMCAMALLHARVSRVVFAASDPKTGAAGSVVNLFTQPLLNHHTALSGGVLAEESSALLQSFFRERRKASRASASDSDSET